MIIIELPLELRKLIEKAKAQYHITGSDDAILKKVIPKLEDEDIIELYNELCEEERKQLRLQGNRPNFEKYREEILDYLDDSVVKAEIIKREQRQSSKPDLAQRNYTYISEFTTTLDNKPDKLKVIQSFYRKIKQLEKERDMLDVKDTINNLKLSAHIYECIQHIQEKMTIDLALYRGPDFKKRYHLKKIENKLELSVKKLRQKKLSKEERNKKLQIMCLNQTVKRVKQLQEQIDELQKQKEQEER